MKIKYLTSTSVLLLMFLISCTTPNTSSSSEKQSTPKSENITDKKEVPKEETPKDKETPKEQPATPASEVCKDNFCYKNVTDTGKVIDKVGTTQKSYTFTFTFDFGTDKFYIDNVIITSGNSKWNVSPEGNIDVKINETAINKLSVRKQELTGKNEFTFLAPLSSNNTTDKGTKFNLDFVYKKPNAKLDGSENIHIKKELII